MTKNMILFSIIFILISLPVVAQQGGPSIRLDPLTVQRVVDPGETLNYKINIENGNKFDPLNIILSISDIIENNKGTYLLKPPGSTSFSLARWVKVEPQKLTVPPGSLKKVDVTISIPRAISGGRYGAIVCTIVPQENQNEGEFGSTKFYFKAPSFLEIAIKGTVPRLEAYATSFDLQLSKEYPSLSSQIGDKARVFDLAIKNEGNIHIITKGRLIISTKEGRRVGEYPLGGGRGVIIPGANVSLKTVMTKDLPPGNYQARAVIDYGVRRPIVSEMDFTITADNSLSKNKNKKQLSHFTILPKNIQTTLRSGSFDQKIIEITNHEDQPIKLRVKILPLEYDLYGNLLPEEKRATAPD